MNRSDKWAIGYEDGYRGIQPSTYDEPYWDGWLTGNEERTISEYEQGETA